MPTRITTTPGGRSPRPRAAGRTAAPVAAGPTAASIDAKAEKVFYTLQALETSNVRERPGLIRRATRQAEAYGADAAAALTARGVAHEVSGLTPEEKASYQADWKSFRISPSGSSALNVLARQVKNQYGIDLVFDPIRLAFAGGRGGYAAELNALVLGTRGLESAGKDATTGHELLHAGFDAARRGRARYDAGAPVNITFSASPPLDVGVPMPSSYRAFMTFEELITHAVNIDLAAKLAAESPTGNRALGAEINRLREVSLYTRLVAERSLAALGAPGRMELKRAGSQATLHLAPDGALSVDLFVPGVALNAPSFDAAAYARGELTRARELAEFNLRYFSGFEGGNVTPTVVDAARRFQDAQRRFLADHAPR